MRFAKRRCLRRCYIRKVIARVYVYVQNVYKQFRNESIITETLDSTFPLAVVTETGLPDSVTGKFETEAQILAKRPQGLLASVLPLKSLV